jgi:SulP family sulfate permease
MQFHWKDELKYLGSELKRRFLHVSLDVRAPLRLRSPDPRREWRRDVIGGLAVCVMAVPQAMAYAILAGVPPIMGLFSVVVVSLVAALWCHSSHLACGPTNTLSLMLAGVLLASTTGGNVLTQVALMALVVGLFQIAAGVLGVGNLTKYISRTVIVAYTAATGVLIFLNQIPNFTGTEVHGARGLFAKVWASLRVLPEAEPASVYVGGITFLAIVLSRRALPKIPAGFTGILVGGVAAWLLRTYDASLAVMLVQDVQRISGAYPKPVLPSFDLGSIYELAGPAIALGMLGCIEVSTISKNLAMRTGATIRTNQDIFALGLGNVAGAFFGAMPGSGSFTRSEFGLRSGITSRLGVVVSAIVALAVIVLAGRLLELVPIPALAALIMWLSLKLVDKKHVRVALLSTYSDALVFLTTFLAAIFLRLDFAIYLGMLVSMALFLQKAAVPRLMEFEFDEQGRFRPVKQKAEDTAPQVSIIHVEGELFFGAAETIQEDIWDSIDRDRTKVVVLRLRNAQNLDATGVMVLDQLVGDLRRMGIHVLVSGTSPEIDRVILRSGLDAVVGKDNYFPSMGNFLDATRRAVLRANEIVGVAKPQVRLFYDKDQEAKRKAAAEEKSNPPEPGQ